MFRRAGTGCARASDGASRKAYSSAPSTGGTARCPDAPSLPSSSRTETAARRRTPREGCRRRPSAATTLLRSLLMRLHPADVEELDNDYDQQHRKHGEREDRKSVV